MLSRYMMFVDGSNLFGVGKHLNLEFGDYELLFKYIFKKCHADRGGCFIDSDHQVALLSRVYWYVVGSIDEWDLANPKAQAHLRRQFESDRDVRPVWMKAASQTLREAGKAATPQAVSDEAWSLCFEDFKQWYENKKSILDGMKRFHYAVEASTDYIEIRQVGHWKVNFLHKSLEEKGVDTSFAVDMVTMISSYEVGILISGDADGIPSVSHVKNSGRHVGSVEFLKGYPPETRARNLSSKLKIAADFVTPIYEMDLVREKIARNPAASVT